MNSSAGIVVRVTRRFDAPAERVFDAWLDPAMLGRWMFGPDVRDEQVVRLQADARVGGGFSFVVRRDGAEIEHAGRYRQIDRPTHLVFTWAAGAVGEVVDDDGSSLVSIGITQLSGSGSGCELVLSHALAPEWAEYAARTEAGWTVMLAALARCLSASTGGPPP